MTALVGEARNRLERDAIGSALTLFSNHHALNIIIVWNILIGSSFCRDEDGHLFYDVLVVIVAAARGEGESSKHHKCDSPEFQCFHFAKNFIFLNYFVWQSYRKSHEKAPGKAWKSGAEGVSLKLLSEFKCLLFDFTVESDVFKISVVYFSFFAAPKYDYSEIICIFAPENKKITIMTAIELRAELFREMSPLLDNESAMTKMLAFVKSLVPAKKAKTESDWANRFAGAWKDSRSAEEIISDIRESRTANSREFEL